MCLMSLLAELLCSVAESTAEVKEVCSVVEEIKHSDSNVERLEKLADLVSSDNEQLNNNDER